jgi:hypothetical protein
VGFYPDKTLQEYLALIKALAQQIRFHHPWLLTLCLLFTLGLDAIILYAAEHLNENSSLIFGGVFHILKANNKILEMITFFLVVRMMLTMT